MSVEAIAPVGAQPVQAGSAPGASDVNVRPEFASQAHEPGMSENIANHVYDTIETIGVELPPVQDTPASKVEKAKQALAPDSKLISAHTADAKPQGNEALVALSKTFDHAVFMAMVNQVISGVGDTSRTLIRQT
ncbi:MAG: hypothetical protein AAF441_05360 [Pseudomonadota bacterium]